MSNTSVVLCTYNGVRFLEEQLESLCKQTLRPRELIVSDDGSTDGTVDLVRQFSSRAPFPVVISTNSVQLGYGENFLVAAQKASSHLVAFCDQDDVWLPNKLERCEEGFSDETVHLVAHTAELIGARGERLGCLQQGITTHELRAAGTQNPWNVFLGFSVVFRRALLEIAAKERRGPDSHDSQRLMAHDRWVFFLANTFCSTAVLAEPLVCYRQHSSNLFGAGRGARLRRLFEPTDKSLQRARAHLLAAQSRGRLLEDIASTASAARVRDLAERGQKLWERLARSEQKRLELYEAASRGRRLSRWISNVANDVYEDPLHARLRKGAATVDLLACVKSS